MIIVSLKGTFLGEDKSKTKKYVSSKDFLAKNLPFINFTAVVDNLLQ